MREIATPVRLTLFVASTFLLLCGSAAAQDGSIAGIVRDASGAVLPGVVVEASSPALIEKSRSTTSDSSGQYRITNLPVGTYKVTFTLEGFTRIERDGIELTTGFTAPVNPVLTVGQRIETVVVTGTPPLVDVQNARQAIVFSGDQIKEMPTARNISSILALTPGLVSSSNQNSQTNGGVCSGGAGIFCSPVISNFNAHASPNDTLDGLQQGRVLVDGVEVNSGVQGLISGMTSGYTADIGSAQEVSIQLTGALGESETGGASINIVPRSGGNRFAGSYNTTYTRRSWFADNTGNHPEVTLVQTTDYDYDVSGTYGGPIKRDRLWFFAQARDQGKHATPRGGEFYYNLNAGKFGANYAPDRARGNVYYQNEWQSISGRFTWQASARNKFTFFWDEQDTCQDPCDGVVSVYTSPESWWSVATHPNRVQQVSWSSPRTNKLLFEGGVNLIQQVYDLTHHRFLTNPQDIPRVTECGDTAGADASASRINSLAGTCALFQGLTSGSLNSNIGGGGAEKRDIGTMRARGSASYITGKHHAKVGYEGGYFSQDTTNQVNDLRLSYQYQTPTATCASNLSCGNTSLYYPSDPNNLARRPVPNSVTINTGQGTLRDHAWFAGFYAQDQWTMRRMTVSGAVRYDHAASGSGETCVGPDKYVFAAYCTPAADGVSFNDITPRWQMAYDLFGNGKTALKWNMGKYLAGTSLNGIFTGSNSARRTVNTLARTWNDANGNRIADCDLLNFNQNGECAAVSTTLADPARYGRSPESLDASGQPVGLTTTPCGRTEAAIPASVKAYCSAYGESLIGGWGKRRYEWQIGIGVQHEILPRLSGEVTFNRRKYGNQMVTDTIGVGCDRFNGKQDQQTCFDNAANYSSLDYDFYQFTAPADPNLPNGGGYVIRGLNNAKFGVSTTGQPQAQTNDPKLDYWWTGVDTNFVWRGPRGLRVNGGTSTGHPGRNTCETEVDAPNVKGRVGNELHGGCNPVRPWQTRWNGSASFLVPKVDVLLSTVFQHQIGVERSANMTVDKSLIAWEPASASRATRACTVNGAATTGCFNSLTPGSTVVNLLDFSDLYGESNTVVDLKIAKVLRFGNRRLNVGADIYNLFNSDAIVQYNDTYIPDNPATPQNENPWGTPTWLQGPRFARISIQFDF
jgi:hypothetical protein